MIATVFRIMALSLWRDRGALVLAFVLPPLMFFVFAEVFSGGGDDLELVVAVADEVGSPRTSRIAEAVAALEGVEARTLPGRTALVEAVRGAEVDAGIWIRAEPGDDLDAEPPLVVVGDSGRALAAAVLSGRLQDLLQRGFPELGVARAAALVDVLAGPYSAEQREAIDETLRALEDEPGALDGDGDGVAGETGLVARELLAGGRRADDAGVSYYAGAVAILFLLFAAMQGAVTLTEERSSGIVDRLVAAPGGIPVIVLGKGLFLTVQGLLQAGLIFACAWLVYGVDLPGRFGPWLVTALAAAAAAAGLGLLLASLSRSRQQAQTASAFVVLILSAIGGSMMPRFLMPGWLRELGWLTPNAWAIDAWQGLFWRGEPVAELVPAWLVLFATAGVAIAASAILAARTSNRA